VTQVFDDTNATLISNTGSPELGQLWLHDLTPAERMSITSQVMPTG